MNKMRLALRTGEKTRGKKLVLTALVLLFILSGCAARRNDSTAPKYTAAQIARDLLVGEKAFLQTAIENHGAECRSA